MIEKFQVDCWRCDLYEVVDTEQDAERIKDGHKHKADVKRIMVEEP